MQSATIAFIGGGNMAHGLIGGLVHANYPAEQIWVCDPNAAKLQALDERYGVHTAKDNEQAAGHAEVVVLAVKPNSLQHVLNQLSPIIMTKKPLLISLAAGVTLATMQKWLGFDTAMIRCMPNIPAIVGSGATALYANSMADTTQCEMAESIMRSVGLTVWLNAEAQLDSVTALSGSGPAYFFLVIEALQLAAEQAGLSPQQARLLTIQTALGSARLALETEQPLSLLRQQVTSKGGTTEQGIAVLQAGNLAELFNKAVQAAKQRAIEISQEFSDSA
jgi:pyrroline-5-carboxylate reductase